MQQVTRRGRGAALALVVATVTLAGGREARAADKPTGAACVAANEQATPLRKAGKLRDARARLRLCSAETCPAAVRQDCIAGAAQAETDIPTVTFAVQDPTGNDLVDVKVSLDGQPLVEKLDGKAIEVDPGEHTFHFETPGQPPVDKRLLIVEGEKNRREKIQLGTPVAVVAPPPVVPPPTPPPPPAKPNTQRTVGLIVGGSGLVVTGVGAIFGMIATLQWGSAKSACGNLFPETCTEPNAANADRSASVRAGTAADVLLAVGGAAVVTGVALVILAPTPGPAGATSASLSLGPSGGRDGGGLILGGAF